MPQAHKAGSRCNCWQSHISFGLEPSRNNSNFIRSSCVELSKLFTLAVSGHEIACLAVVLLRAYCRRRWRQRGVGERHLVHRPHGHDRGSDGRDSDRGHGDGRRRRRECDSTAFRPIGLADTQREVASDSLPVLSCPRLLPAHGLQLVSLPPVTARICWLRGSSARSYV